VHHNIRALRKLLDILPLNRSPSVAELVANQNECQLLLSELLLRSLYNQPAKLATGAARKKAIVAVARQLAVDLWRIKTGQLRSEELGLIN